MKDATGTTFDSILVIAFGGPTTGEQGHDFVKGIVGERPGAEGRIREVAGHYEVLGGSPFNELTFQQASKLGEALGKRGIEVPIFCGMRHWDPHVRDVMKDMADRGHRRALGVIMAPHQCWISWDWYQLTVDEANKALGDRRLDVSYIEAWWTEDGFIEANVDRIEAELGALGEMAPDTEVVFTAHSIPIGTCPDCKSGKRTCPYSDQFEESARLTARALRHPIPYSTSYQSQAGASPSWTRPDINDHIRSIGKRGVKHLVLEPIGFLCDHVEVLYDLDVEARKTCEDQGIEYRRAGTVGTHPAFIDLLANRIEAAFRGQ